MREKYVKEYCVIKFTCKWLLTFQRFILKLNEKVQSSGVPDFGVLSPESLVLSPTSQDPGLGSWVPGAESRLWVVSPRPLF